jgi:AcrR family transcriptional regulator
MSNFDVSPHVFPPRQQRSRKALAKIVKAAEHILRTEGFDGFSMAAVAKTSGLPVGNIYRRFKGKSELLQALKEDVTSRIEKAVLERLSKSQHSGISPFVQGFVAAVIQVFVDDESVHRILFDARVRDDPAMDRIGSSGRHRIFNYYREGLLPLLARIDNKKAETLARVSFQIMASAVVGKAQGSDRMLSSLSWTELQAEFAAAAIAYLTSSITGPLPVARPKNSKGIDQKRLLVRRRSRAVPTK